MSRYADVVVNITARRADRLFQYRIPDELDGQVSAGVVVRVPFGGKRMIDGYVVGVSEEAAIEPQRIRDIAEVRTEGLGEESRLIRLAAWMKDTYGCQMIQALRTVIPVRERVRHQEKKTVHLTADQETALQALEECRRKNQKARARLLEALIDEPDLPWELVRDKLHITTSVVTSLQEASLISIERRVDYRNPVRVRPGEDEALPLNTYQQQAVDTILGEWDVPASQLPHGGCYLIHGVTGSGKTLVYMTLIEEALRRGRQAIVLIPEIALTYQTVLRFYRRFGDQVSLINSRLSAGERYDQFERARRGGISVMIGPRSALFTPFPDLGIIVIDEEQESAYQSETMPRYQTRDVARERARLEGARLVLGSATPSVDAYYAARQGKSALLKLPERAGGAALPSWQIVDMRQEMRAGVRGMISRALADEIGARLEVQEQVMLFLNRRGLAGFVSCRSCGHVVKCPHCDVSLALHRGGRLICHYCGYEQPAVHTCPECGEEAIRTFKAGTEQVEDEVRALFPQARMLRMDADTTRHKDDHEKILSAFAGHEADILIGTQMIIKGHDFPDVTLMGILAADLSLHAPDFRAAERTYQLIAQAAGRAGRASRPGQVLIQTYDPEHECIRCAAEGSYEDFYEQEILYRKAALYPPAGALTGVHVSGSDEAYLTRACLYLKQFAQTYAQRLQVQVLGPAAEPIAKVQDIYRMVMYLKHEDPERVKTLRRLIERYIEANEGFAPLTIQYEVF